MESIAAGALLDFIKIYYISIFYYFNLKNKYLAGAKSV